MAKKSPICQFCNNQMSTPRKSTATIALDSRLGLRNQTATIALDSRLGLRNQPVCSISPIITTSQFFT